MSRLEWATSDGSVDWPRVLLVGVTGAVLVALVVVASTSTAAFGPFNPGWDGTSDFREQVGAAPGVELTTATAVDSYGAVEPAETVAFVVAPGEEYSEADATRVRRFVADGGRLVVMENFGTAGNALLADVGASARVDGRLVRDEQHNAEAPTIPVATNVTDHPLTAGVEQLTLNYGSVVEPGSGTVLVRTSEFGYLTTDEETGLEEDTDLAASPVATVEPVGDGQVVVVSDPSILINVMEERPDNTAFVQALYGDAERVLVDRSHAPGLPPLTRALLAVRGSPLLGALLGGVAVLGVAVAAERSVPGRVRRAGARPLASVRPGGRGDPGLSRPMTDGPGLSRPMTDDQRAAYVRRQHPDWDEERIRRVITALNTGGLKREDERE